MQERLERKETGWQWRSGVMSRKHSCSWLRRGNVFHDLDATNSDFIVTHFDEGKNSARRGRGKGKLDDPFLQPSLPHFPLPPLPAPDPVALANLNKVRHIVVLMQENRSFDNMLAFLALPPFSRSDVDGVRDTMANSFEGARVAVNALVDRRFPLSPAHDRAEVAVQIADGKMSGFLRSWRRRFGTVPITGPNRRTALSFHTAEHVPTYRFLAENYAICNRWFAAYPGPTQPNRFCTLSGFTPALDNLDVDDPELGYLGIKTFFEHLDPNQWVYFEKDVGFIRVYDRFRIDDKNVVPFDDKDEGFYVRASKGDLPAVTFIDPNFRDIPPIRLADDDLPPADVKHGQDSIACIYNALVRSPAWNRTLPRNYLRRTWRLLRPRLPTWHPGFRASRSANSRSPAGSAEPRGPRARVRGLPVGRPRVGERRQVRITHRSAGRSCSNSSAKMHQTSVRALLGRRTWGFCSPGTAPARISPHRERHVSTRPQANSPARGSGPRGPSIRGRFPRDDATTRPPPSHRPAVASRRDARAALSDTRDMYAGFGPAAGRRAPLDPIPQRGLGQVEIAATIGIDLPCAYQEFDLDPSRVGDRPWEDACGYVCTSRLARAPPSKCRVDVCRIADGPTSSRIRPVRCSMKRSPSATGWKDSI